MAGRRDSSIVRPMSDGENASGFGGERYRRIGRVLGPLVFVLMLTADGAQDVMAQAAWRAAAVALWMAIWWATEALPVAATAFLPLVVFEPLGVATIADAARSYAHPIVFLFLGGFLVAIGVERCGLHRRMSIAILLRVGSGGRRLVGGFMLAAAFLSMWITNTSTTMMLLPIVMSIVGVVRDNVDGIFDEAVDDFAIAMLLGVAYAASIGGLATLIGTPPNAFLAGFLAETYGYEVSFARWMLLALPVTLLMLPSAWWLLTRALHRVDIPESDAVASHLVALREQMGPMTPPERRVAMLFGGVVASWVLRRPLAELLGLTSLSDAGIAMTFALLLFVVPSGRGDGRALLSWDDTTSVPWGVLVLFGGGLSLATAVSETGLSLWLGERLAGLGAAGAGVLVVSAVVLVVFLTELTSNLATTATLLPALAAIAVEAGVSPILLVVPVTIAASCAFMLPVATPPNAIVFATGRVGIPQMVRAGFWLNVIGVVVVSAVGWLLVPVLLTP